MRKKVAYKGSIIVVEFEKSNFTRVIDKMNGIVIAQAHGTKDFIINGMSYTVGWSMRCREKSSVTLHFEGFSCGDSEKKMIEHIIEKYGLAN